MVLFALVWDGGRSRGCPWRLLYVMFVVGLGMMRCSRAILYVPKQASVVLSCVQDNSKLELIVVVVCC